MMPSQPAPGQRVDRLEIEILKEASTSNFEFQPHLTHLFDNFTGLYMYIINKSLYVKTVIHCV